jgi:apolipoprotein D and lipocalin family protein
MTHKRLAFLYLPLALALGACQSVALPPIKTVTHVDLQRFMGDWYVIASIPTFIERDAYNAIESYRLNADGSIATTFTFRQGGFDGEPKRYTPTGYVFDTGSNAVWGMQFLWPIKADYRVVYLDADYTQTVIGRDKRDYVWIMARQPVLPAADYARLLTLLAEQGYDVSKIQRVPQQWN